MFFGDIMIDSINKILWGIVTIFIIIFGFYFSKKLKFKQFKIHSMITSFSSSLENKGISTFSSFLMTLAARVGVGSIAGVSLAIYLGGPGSLFWIIVMSFLSSIICYCETYLGIKYRKNIDGVKTGGPFYYIKYGLGKKNLSFYYAFIMLVACTFGFISIQSNTIIKSLDKIINVNNLWFGIFLSMFIFLIIYKGINSIIKFITKLVPFMLSFYFVFCFIIIFKNLSILPKIINLIITEAFNFKSFFSGFISTFLIGIQRGIFSSEAGLGTCTIASSLSDSDDIFKQCNVQMLSVYITSILVCGITGFVILCSNYNNVNFVDINGIEITKFAFSSNIGNIGNYVVFITIFLFSISSIISCYYDGEVCAKYLGLKNVMLLKIITVIIIISGSIISSSFLWNIIDVFIAVLSIINIYTIFLLRNEIK